MRDLVSLTMLNSPHMAGYDDLTPIYGDGVLPPYVTRKQ